MFLLPLKLAGLICAFGLMWIGEVARRLPKDIEEFRNAQNNLDRLVIGIIWVITIGMLVFISIPITRAIWYVWGLFV